MSIVKSIKQTLQNRTLPEVLVRMKTSVATVDRGSATGFDQGSAYLLPAGQAADWIRCGMAAAIIEPADVAAANHEISIRSLYSPLRGEWCVIEGWLQT